MGASVVGARRAGGALLLAASVSLGGVITVQPDDEHGGPDDDAGPSVIVSAHAKGRAAEATGTSSAHTWTPRPGSASSPGGSVGSGQDQSGSTQTGCDCEPAPIPRVERVAGTDRYATAAALVPEFRNEVSTVYVVNGGAFADAASAASAAAAGVVPDVSRGRAWAPAPMVLTRRDSLPAATRAALRGLSLERIVIVGGPGVVSDAVREDLKSYADPVIRVGGRSRYAVSATLAERFPRDTDTVYVASGEDHALADALAGGALAGQQGAPVLLTRPDRLDPVTRHALQTLSPSRTVVLGGPNAVSPAVYAEIGADARFYGDSRYSTAVAIAGQLSAEQSGAFLASGQAFPDALTGAALAGSLRQPLLLARSSRIPDPVMHELARLSPAQLTLLGGTASLSAGVEDQANASYPAWTR
ncbi:MAG: cell wall-binding repeat-containing protein [Ornithinimicrobium sp.]